MLPASLWFLMPPLISLRISILNKYFFFLFSTYFLIYLLKRKYPKHMLSLYYENKFPVIYPNTITNGFREGNGTPLQYSCLENPMDGGAWWAAVRGVAKSQIGLSDFTFTFPFHALEKEMATQSSILAWRIPGTGEPGGLTSMGSHRVGHDWSDLTAAAA